MFGLNKSTRYEYESITSKKPIEANSNFEVADLINERGQYGWELIGTILDVQSMSYIYYFKRTK